MPTVRRMSNVRSSSAVSIPLTVTMPSCGTRMALQSFASVDLPEPLCPRTATKLPRSIDRLTFLTTAGVFGISLSYAKLTFLNSMMFSFI